jgi:anti-sigma factor RsiW
MDTLFTETESDRRIGDALRKHAPRRTAPPRLRRNIAALLRAQQQESRPDRVGLLERLMRQVLPLGAGFAAASVVGIGALHYQARLGDDELLGQQIVSARIRTSMPTLSSAAIDARTLRGWLSDQLSFSPAVAELSPHGYRLVAGRLEHVLGRAVASIQYSRDGHLVNVLACPLRDGGSARSFHRDGFNVVGWTDSQLQYWAVSDVDSRELSDFALSFRQAAGQS